MARVYKQAALYLLAGWPDADVGEMTSTLEGAEAPLSKQEPRTSAKKAKFIREDDFRRLCRHLVRPGVTRSSYETLDWLVAAVATGLRPGEWREAALLREGSLSLLVFQRTKTTNGRGLGVEAVLDVSALGEVERAAILRMAERGRIWHEAHEFHQRQESCGQLLRAACKALWPNRTRTYSLYSCRHQATSLFKAALAPEEVAAILGHAVTGSMVSYGRRSQAWLVDSCSPPPRPTPAAVAAVRSSPKTFRPRHPPLKNQFALPVTQGRR